MMQRYRLTTVGKRYDVGDMATPMLADDDAGELVLHSDALAHADERAARELPCAICGKPATCLGAYEDERRLGLACDGCCGHGCEDGWCKSLRDMSIGDVLTHIGAQVHGLAQERDEAEERAAQARREALEIIRRVAAQVRADSDSGSLTQGALARLELRLVEALAEGRPR